MPTSILDLPTELILEIIHSDDSTDATIAYLGMTCRRLHDICQVPVLERQLPVLRALASKRCLLIYKNSFSSIAMRDEELDDVKEIFQASFHKIKYVPVTFTVEEIASVHGLIFHANTVNHIDIKLDSPTDMYTLAEKKDWCKPLASLIRVSSEKDMASLTIKGLPHGKRLRNFTPILPIPQTPILPFPNTPSSPVKNYVSTFSPLEDGLFGHKARSGGIGTQPNRQVGTPEREGLPNSGVYLGTPRGLKSFEIDSPLPFHGVCFPQTLRALNGGYLTKLSLWNTRLCMSDWSHILPLLSMPLLSEFNVGDSVIAFRDLSPFLHRHLGITHLDLSFSSPIGLITPPAGVLPHLEVISGNPDYVLGLLSSQRHLFPNLRSVALTRHPPRTIQHGVLDNILRNLSDHKRGTINLSIEFSDATGLTEWFSEAKSCSLNCVKTLEIILFGFRMSSKMCNCFFCWVEMVFPYVQKLYLTWRVVPTDLIMWSWKLVVLWDSCPELQSIRVGIETYQRPVKAVKYYSR